MGIKDSLSESGKSSSTRIVMYGTAITVLGVYMAHNILSMVRGGGVVDFALNSVVVLGIAMTGKVVQKFGENGTKKPEAQ